MAQPQKTGEKFSGEFSNENELIVQTGLRY